jgi:hypothetical protein
MRRLLSLLIGLPGLLAAAVDEHALIAEQRQAVIERAAAEERDCQRRFVVTACVERAHARRREALAPLRERDLRLDEAEREQRARASSAATRRPQSGDGRRVVAASAPASGARAARLAPVPAAHAAQASQAPDAVEARAAAERVRAAERRRQHARATQDRVARRLAERAAHGRSNEALPKPTAASAAAR